MYNMYILFESIFVGLYSLFLYVLLNLINFNNLFILGFIKQLFGYLFLHKYYCIYGNACQNIGLVRPSTGSKCNPYIIIESIGEGLLYLLLGYIMIIYGKLNKWFAVFSIGFMLHLLFDISGIHQYYCNFICI